MAKSMDENVKKTYEFLKLYFSKHNYAPSLREITEAINVKSIASVSKYLKALEQEGLITLSDNKSRAIELTVSEAYRQENLRELKVLGTIPAGTPMEAIEESTESFVFSKDMFHSGGELFMLEVKGSSMINIGIYNGDYLIVRHQNHAEDKAIVAALVDNENVTVKRLIKDSAHRKIILRPENSAMSDYVYDSGSVKILGVVVGLIRTRI